jgi:hypothetical protein
MPPMITKPLVPFERRIAKWVFFPLVLGALVVGSIMMSIDRHRCVTGCESGGYKFTDYTPRLRGASHSVCTCSKDGVTFELPTK